MNNTKYIFSADCIPVKGYLRSVLIDLGRNKYFYIPNELVNIILAQDVNILPQDYREFLIENEILITVPDIHVDFFPEISLDWDFPSKLMRCFYEFQQEGSLEVFTKLESVDLYELNIIISLEDVPYVINMLQNYFFNQINIYLKEDVYERELINVANQSPHFNFFIKLKQYHLITPNVFALENFPFETYEKSKRFYVTISLFMESLCHNLFYNRTIFIRDNEIYNYWNNKESKGGFLRYDLDNILNDSYFSIIWNVSKDKFVICKDCEYKNMCIDNRIPLIQGDNYYLKEECSYNPYISKWKGEEGYMSLNEVGVKINNESILIDEDFIKEVNNRLWEK